MNAVPKFIRPRIVPETHPVETGHYVLATPAILNLLDSIKQWIDARATGGIVFGIQRFGKSRAIRYLASQLPEIFAKALPVLRFNCREYRTPTEGVFFEDLLRAFGHALYKSGKPAAKRDRLTEFLREKVEASGQSRLIMFVDEAQKLHEIQYKWLIDLFNELDELGVSPTALLVGQPELVHQRNAFVRARKRQILGRFMAQQHHFVGLRSASDMRVCLFGYDENSEYPPGSGWSFTQYYFPAAFAEGWRLANEADTVWRAFVEVHGESRLAGAPEIPMQYFVGAVRYVLRQYGSLSDAAPAISLNIWKEAVHRSGYDDAARYVVAPADQDDEDK